MGANSERQQVGADPRINQLVSVQSDLLTQLQTSMMGRFVNSIIPAPHPENLSRPDQTQRIRQLFDPYPGEDRRSYQNSEVGRYGGRARCLAATAMHVASQDTLRRNAPRKALVHLNYRGPGQWKSYKEFFSMPNYRDYRHRGEKI